MVLCWITLSTSYLYGIFLVLPKRTTPETVTLFPQKKRVDCAIFLRYFLIFREGLVWFPVELARFLVVEGFLDARSIG